MPSVVFHSWQTSFPCRHFHHLAYCLDGSAEAVGCDHGADIHSVDTHSVDTHNVDYSIQDSSPSGMDCNTCSNSSRTMSSEDIPTMCSRMGRHIHTSRMPKE